MKTKNKRRGFITTNDVNNARTSSIRYVPDITPILELLDRSYPIHVRNDVKCSILDILIFF